MQNTYQQHEPSVTQLVRQFLGPKNGLKIAPANLLDFSFPQTFIMISLAVQRAPFGRHSGDISRRSQMRIALFGRLSGVARAGFVSVRKGDSQRSGAARVRFCEVRRCDSQCSGAVRVSFLSAHKRGSQHSGAVLGRFFDVHICDSQGSGAVRVRLFDVP